MKKTDRFPHVKTRFLEHYLLLQLLFVVQLFLEKVVVVVVVKTTFQWLIYKNFAHFYHQFLITAIFKKSIVFSNKNIAFLNISVKTIKHQPSL